eukprot:Lithocolla_globosa_v1_NODE_3722_length_1597_cov_31.643969.p1 type:complete len:469 gc:universal NODE_3722_length_1597_cov_31.643969:48-1454(+)
MEIDTPEQPTLPALLSDIKANIGLLEKFVGTSEARFVHRVLRSIPAVRHRLSLQALHQLHRLSPIPLLNELLPNTQQDAMEVDSEKSDAKQVLPEVEVYFGLLLLLFLIDQKSYQKASVQSSWLVEAVQTHNRRSLDPLAAKCYFYASRVHDLQQTTNDTRTLLMNSLRTATLRHDEECQATLVNILLRNLLASKLYDQADKLVSKTAFPSSASAPQLARYHYYLGRIRATQLEYSESHRHLLTAIRKAPQTDHAPGFQQTVHKFAIVVQLLLGEIPERALFRRQILRKPLIPYLHVTHAVRLGDLQKFQEIMNTYSETFKRDHTYTLILRLRHNVIKTGVRMISLSYSRILLKDICSKLHLDSIEDAEYIVTKAIRDGVIEATVDHENGYMKSKELADVYSSNEPAVAFHQRITFCLDLHNDAIKALRFPPGAYRKKFESIEDRREREQQESELAKELSKEEDDEGF